MYVQRRDDTDSCPTGMNNCSLSYAITGPDPSEQEGDSVYGPTNYGKPGPHRFIGIAMVAAIIFLGLTAYLAFGKGPRRWRKRHCRCLGGRNDEVVEEEASMKPVPVVLDAKSSVSYSSTEEKPQSPRASNSIPAAQAESRSKSRRKQSSRSRSQHGKNRRRTGDASVGHVAKDARDVDEEPGHLVTGWEVEHLKGVRYEVRTPIDDQTGQRLEVTLQKPCLAYHQR
ncbi:hypothetical protein AN958_04979 [Leucoagaricus sp. SymC.cos]|nr:hypothetical protein AN958_04979 [Leucoagaricus sp. SymC.cos]